MAQAAQALYLIATAAFAAIALVSTRLIRLSFRTGQAPERLSGPGIRTAMNPSRGFVTLRRGHLHPVMVVTLAMRRCAERISSREAPQPVRDPLIDIYSIRCERAGAVNRSRNERRRERLASLARRCRLLALGMLLATLAAHPGRAQEPSKEQMQGLDEQVQEIKSDVLGIAAELGRLEEKLLYPSNTQVAVFVSLAQQQGFQPDSIQIQIDGELVAHHIYSFKELEALQKGGVQRLYTGNVPTGEHRLDVTVAGSVGGSDVASTESFTFQKAAEPKLVELRLAEGSGGASIQLGGS